MSPDGLLALVAATMLAASPITGDCQARTISLCTGDGEVHTMLVWDQDMTPRQRQPSPSNNACHACVLDKRKAQGDHQDEEDA